MQTETNKKTNNGLTITSYFVNIAHEEGPVKAYCSITFNNCFAVHKIRIVECKQGKYIVNMPSLKSKNGQFEDVCHPTNSETRKQIEACLLEAYLGKLKSDLKTPTNGRK